MNISISSARKIGAGGSKEREREKSGGIKNRTDTEQKQGTWNREQGTGNREQGTGNREQGTGNREQGTETRRKK